MLFAMTSSLWDGLSDGWAILSIALLLLVGAAIGFAMRSLAGHWRAEAIEKKMRLREAEAESEIRARIKDADIAARAAVVKAREEFEKSSKQHREELRANDERQTRREAALDAKAAALDERDAKSEARAAAAAAAVRESEAKLAAADAQLREIAQMSHRDARREILKRANDELRADAAILSRRIQEAARERGERLAAKIVADAVQRCAAAHAAEIAVTAVALPNPEMKGRIVGREGRNVRAFEAATGVNLLLDDAPDSVVLSAFDPMRREIARIALAALIADGRIHPAAIEAAAQQAAEQVAEAALAAGTAAAEEAGVSGLPAETLRQMGALKFRTSFTQNVLRHSVEVAMLAGAMAAEMGLDAATARRAGFLHDIGKTMSAEKAGSHAALGADWLRARGESAAVCDAVAAHHAAPGTDGGVYGTLVAAADAISSARPGARLESLADYVQRIRNIEKIARGFPGVASVFAVQAGRDVRVIVDPARISDGAASELAAQISRTISERLKFPGLIRVTVVRETRCVEYAR